MIFQKGNNHSFDVDLATQIGVEKAILVGHIQFWISANEQRRSAAHYRNGEYWTYATGADFAAKFPYLKAPSVYRWLQQLEEDGWIKRGRFNKENTDKTQWFGRGESLKNWLNSSIYQNDKSGQKRGASIYQNDNSIYQNDNSIYQNDKSAIYNKDTIQTTIQNTDQSAKTRGENLPESDVEFGSVEAEECPSNPPVATAPFSPQIDASLIVDEWTGKLANHREFSNGLQRLFNLDESARSYWIGQFVLTQFTSQKLTGRDFSDMADHCQKWIKIQLEIKSREQRQQRTATSAPNQSAQRSNNGRTNSGPTKRVAYIPEDN